MLQKMSRSVSVLSSLMVAFCVSLIIIGCNGCSSSGELDVRESDSVSKSEIVAIRKKWQAKKAKSGTLWFDPLKTELKGKADTEGNWTGLVTGVFLFETSLGSFYSKSDKGTLKLTSGGVSATNCKIVYWKE